MRKNAAAPALVFLALLAGVSGCGETPTKDVDPTGAAVPTPTSTAIPEASAPPFTDDVLPDDGGYGTGNGLGLTGVRTARERGYDRVIFDLGGSGIPGWRVEYTTSPTYEGSGEPVTLKGTVFLQVVLRGVGLPYDTGLAPFGDSTTRVPGTGTKGIAEIAPGGVFEGEQQAFIGLAGTKRPFRVFTLADPARVVVDVRDG